MYATDFLITIRRIMKLQETVLKEVCQEFSITLTEATIISFLHNNPKRDTAADIVELRMLQKGNVSQAVETLYQKSFLKRDKDKDDRRKIHLSLTGKAEPIVNSIETFWRKFETDIFAGVSDTELAAFIRVSDQVKVNIEAAVKRRG